MLAAMQPVLVRQHLETAPAGKLARWLDARGIAYVVDRSWLGRDLPDPAAFSFVASLGHNLGAGDTHQAAVAGEHALLGEAVARGIPVLGLCYGAQVLAAVLGGQVSAAAVPELGWRAIETDDPGRVPAGPWLAWHYDVFSVPPGATEIARTADASQAFRVGPHLGVQFHPEATPEIVAGWARADADRLVGLGLEGTAAQLGGEPDREAAADAAAFRLFDAFLAQADLL